MRRAGPRPVQGVQTGEQPDLREAVADGLSRRYSPEQISHRLGRDFPDDESMRVSHETIYQALYFRPRWIETRSGSSTSVRTDAPQTAPAPDSRTHRFMTDDHDGRRPAEVADRAVPGHWEGDLIMGQANKTAIATLVERATRYTMLVRMPTGTTPKSSATG